MAIQNNMFFPFYSSGYTIQEFDSMSLTISAFPENGRITCPLYIKLKTRDVVFMGDDDERKQHEKVEIRVIMFASQKNPQEWYMISLNGVKGKRVIIKGGKSGIETLLPQQKLYVKYI
jgi:hypothetical protein